MIKPTLGDAAADLRRAIYASFSEKKFASPSAVTFLKNAQSVVRDNYSLLTSDNRDQYEKVMSWFDEKNCQVEEKREYLLMAAIFLEDAVRKG